jgi:D-3-phosphoglycerate dehydrogenase
LVGDGPYREYLETVVENLDISNKVRFVGYVDRPGVVGAVGNALGVAKINIAGMQVARQAQGGSALMAITVDSSVSESVAASVAKEIGADLVRSVSLVN